MCAKFVYYYRTKCFNKQVENIDRIKQGETGPKRLQGNILFQGHGSLFKAYHVLLRMLIDLISTALVVKLPFTQKEVWKNL